MSLQVLSTGRLHAFFLEGMAGRSDFWLLLLVGMGLMQVIMQASFWRTLLLQLHSRIYSGVLSSLPNSSTGGNWMLGPVWAPFKVLIDFTIRALGQPAPEIL